MNAITITGNIVGNLETAISAGGVCFTKFIVAVDRVYSNSAGESVTDYFHVIAWRGLGDRCKNSLILGDKVAVCGSMQSRKHVDRNGVERILWGVDADSVELLSPR